MTNASSNPPKFVAPLTISQQQVLSLAGIAQCVALVRDIAHTGQYDRDQALVCWQSLFVTQPPSFAHVFAMQLTPNEPPINKANDLANDLDVQAIKNLQLGLITLEKLLTQDKDAILLELTRYVIGIIHLQRKLNKQPTVMAALATQLDITSAQVDYFGIDHENVSASLADIYSNHISQLGYRIKVTGDPIYLKQTAIANRVRSFLLAGIRCTILWRQVGGRRWQFILSKKRLLQDLHYLIERSHLP